METAKKMEAMKKPEEDSENTEKKCCPEFNPKKWEGKTFRWKDKLFIKESMATFFHIPFPWIIKKKIAKLCDTAKNARAELPDQDFLMLFKDPSAFKSNLYLAVTKSVKDVDNVKISGTFMAKVFDGPYKDIPKFMKQMNEELAKKGKTAKTYYVHYAYCPECSKKYGHNYMILFAAM